MPEIRFEPFGQVKESPCDCGCGQIHRRLRGQAVRPESDSSVLLFAVLARHKAERHVWLAIGSGSWDERDRRDCFCSVEAWVVDGKVACRATEGDESPFKREALFAQKVARLVRRDEVMDDPDRKAWLFGWVDDVLLQVGAIRDFVSPQQA